MRLFIKLVCMVVLIGMPLSCGGPSPVLRDVYEALCEDGNEEACEWLEEQGY